MTDDLPGHDPGLPDRHLREHCLAAAIRAVEVVLRRHRYPDPTRSLEIIVVALDDTAEDDPVH